MTGTTGEAARGTVDHVAANIRHEVEDFLYRESRLLDEHRHDEWLDLLDDDFLYRMPLPVAHEEISAGRYDSVVELANESKSFLRMRFGRIDSDFAWAERPAPFIRHFVSNVIVEEAGPGEEWIVWSNVMVVRSRQPEDPILASAGRRDRIRRHGESFRLLGRTVYLDTEVPNDGQLGVIY
jgi:3-phenylpropionate/cinnamic acid dioxygenase small subunit